MLVTPPKKRKTSKPEPARSVNEEKTSSRPRPREQTKEQADKKGPNSHVVNLRVPMQIVDDIDYWVDTKNYKSRSEFVLASIRFYLDYIEYKESYNVRTFQRGQVDDLPSSRFDRLKYLRGSEK
jgi:Arc/MetJ-type ribon-helix-helix transcriptional regulator